VKVLRVLRNYREVVALWALAALLVMAEVTGPIALSDGQRPARPPPSRPATTWPFSGPTTTTGRDAPPPTSRPPPTTTPPATAPGPAGASTTPGGTTATTLPTVTVPSVPTPTLPPTTVTLPPTTLPDLATTLPMVTWCTKPGRPTPATWPHYPRPTPTLVEVHDGHTVCKPAR
jgi:hypothetical protein